MKTASDLLLTEEQHNALLSTLSLMESGNLRHISQINEVTFVKLPLENSDLNNHRFSMNVWTGVQGCGSVGCIGGTACIIAHNYQLFDNIWTVNLPLAQRKANKVLENLFYPPTDKTGEAKHNNYNAITVEEAAVQLRKYLETGTHDWDTQRFDPDDYDLPSDDGRAWPQADNE